MSAQIALPGSPAYEARRRPANPRFADVRPHAIVSCASAEDVAEAMAYARRARQPLAVRSGGHCFAGRSTTQGVLVDLSPMTGVRVDAQGLATVLAGTRLGDLYDALSRRGLTIPAGCGPTVGISGLTLGGGLGILGRTHGLTCDSLRAATLVLGDGRTVECSGDRHADLFWMLRGGGAFSGGLPGVVTSLVFQTVAEPDATGFHLMFAPSQAVSVVATWQEEAPDAPDEVAASLVISASADPARPVVTSLFGAVLGDVAPLDRLVRRIGMRAEVSHGFHGHLRATKRWLAGLEVHGGPEPAGGHAYPRSEYFRSPMPDDTVAALIAHLMEDRRPGQARELDFTPWGGAYNRVPVDATAFAHRSERFLLKHTVTVPVGDGPAEDWLRRSWEIAHPSGTGGAYPNFPETGRVDADAAHYGPNLARLRAIGSAYGAVSPGLA